MRAPVSIYLEKAGNCSRKRDMFVAVFRKKALCDMSGNTVTILLSKIKPAAPGSFQKGYGMLCGATVCRYTSGTQSWTDSSRENAISMPDNSKVRRRCSIGSAARPRIHGNNIGRRDENLFIVRP